MIISKTKKDTLKYLHLPYLEPSS